MVTGRDIADLLSSWRMITSRVMKTTPNTWSQYTSFLMNKIIGSQGQTPHQRMELHFLRGAWKIKMIKTIMIDKKFPSIMNVARRYALDPNFQAKG